MDLKVKLLNSNAIPPQYAHATDAGLDLYACTMRIDRTKGYYEYGTGIAVQIPEGYVGLIFCRSSVRDKDGIQTNHVGVIDSGYRGEIMVTFKNYGGKAMYASDAPYEIGAKFAQLVIVPYLHVNPVLVTDLDPSDRGSKGHGSSGK